MRKEYAPAVRIPTTCAPLGISPWDLWQRVGFHSTLSRSCNSIGSVRDTESNSFAARNRASTEERHSGEARWIEESRLDWCKKILQRR